MVIELKYNENKVEDVIKEGGQIQFKNCVHCLKRKRENQMKCTV